VNRGSADRVRAKTLLKFPVAPSLKTDLSALIAARPVFEALINLQDTDMIFLSNMQKTRPSDKLGMKQNFMPASHKNSISKN
jgi:hypothetical protein